jgi:uncharacterized protein (TIGR02452 family)
MIIKTISGKTNPKDKNKSLAKETLEILKNKSYSFNSTNVSIATELDYAISNTEYYPDELEVTLDAAITPTLEVVNETTSQAAFRLLSAGKDNVVALNFASARNPGGGWLHGAQAQEEDLCRTSGLYSCLLKKPLYYNANILCDNSYYTNGMIYSPKVPFFRDHNNLLLETPFPLSIITAPAPCLINMDSPDEDRLDLIFKERTIKILQIAHKHGHKNIILGAWGAGAFRNDPVRVAYFFRNALQAVQAFENVCFAVYDTSPDLIRYNTFKQIIK